MLRRLGNPGARPKGMDPLSELSLTSFRRCSTCRMHYPATSQFFSRNRTRGGGPLQLRYICKVCDARKHKAAGGYVAWRRVWTPPSFHRCAGCDCVKSLAVDFYVLKTGRIDKRCKDCQRRGGEEYRASEDVKERARIQARVWHKANREQAAQRSREYYQANKERFAAYAKEYRERTREQRQTEEAREKNRENARRSYHKNKEKARASNREYIKRNPEANAERTRRRYALKVNAEGSHTIVEVRQMYADQDGRCAYCEVELNGRYVVEHMIPLSRGGRDDWTNLAIACALCNNRKYNRTTEEFFADMRRYA